MPNTVNAPSKQRYDYLIVGAGLTGAVLAERARSSEGHPSVLVIDKRDHIAGNIYTEDTDGIAVHRYGAHIFHTSDKGVWDYACRFADFNHYVNSPVARYGDEIYNLPFNMNTFSQMWRGEVFTPEDAERKIGEQKAEAVAALSGGEPSNLEEQALSLVGADIYAKLIKGYTEKQWGRDCRELPSSIIKRLPVRLTYDNNYFNDRYQGIPENGYTDMVDRMLGETEVMLSADYREFIETYPDIADKIIYCGPIDEFYDFRLGQLEYRSLRFETERLEENNHQGNAVVNYTAREVPYTRIIEHKHFTFGDDLPHTFVTREYPADWHPGDEPYYPLNDERNQELYERYAELARKEDKVVFAGRLGGYKYYDMDKAIAAALSLAGKLFE